MEYFVITVAVWSKMCSTIWQWGISAFSLCVILFPVMSEHNNNNKEYLWNDSWQEEIEVLRENPAGIMLKVNLGMASILLYIILSVIYISDICH